MVRVRSPQDLGASLVFLLIGFAGLFFGRDLAMGTALRMGPGYFPFLLCGLIILIGVILGVRSIAFDGPPVEPFHFRPLVLVLGSIAASGYLMNLVGLALTTIVFTLIASFARPGPKLREMLPLGVGLAFFVILVFVYGLRQPLPAWWGR